MEMYNSAVAHDPAILTSSNSGMEQPDVANEHSSDSRAFQEGQRSNVDSAMGKIAEENSMPVLPSCGNMSPEKHGSKVEPTCVDGVDHTMRQQGTDLKVYNFEEERDQAAPATTNSVDQPNAGSELVRDLDAPRERLNCQVDSVTSVVESRHSTLERPAFVDASMKELRSTEEPRDDDGVVNTNLQQTPKSEVYSSLGNAEASGSHLLKRSSDGLRRRSVNSPSASLQQPRHESLHSEMAALNGEGQLRGNSAENRSTSVDVNGERRSNAGVVSWKVSEEPCSSEQDISEEEIEDRKRDKMLWIWVGLFSLAMIIAFACLTTFAVISSKPVDDELPTTVSECETGPWSEWTVCSEACGESKQVRSRIITAAPGTVLGCPTLHEERSCSGSCTLFIVTREASIASNSLSEATLIANSSSIRITLSEALGLDEKRLTFSALGMDASTGIKYWRVQFLFLVDRSLPSSNPDADLGRNPERVLKLLEEQLADTSLPVYVALNSMLPGLDSNTPFRLHAYTATPSTLTEPIDMCLLLGSDAPSTCGCKVSDWSEWTACDKSCSELSSTRTRTITNPTEVSDSTECPKLKEERACTGETRLYLFQLPPGFDLGSTTDIKNRLQICNKAVLQELRTLLGVEAPERTAFVGSSKDQKFWKFSVLLKETHNVEQVISTFDTQMQDSDSSFFNALAQCMVSSGKLGSVPKPSQVDSPTTEQLCP